MLGMMNSPNDAVEFYASPPGKSAQEISDDVKRTLTKPKEKPTTTYTADGRRLVNGKAEEEQEPSVLWGGALLRSAVRKMGEDKRGKKLTVASVSTDSIEVVEEPELCTAAEVVEEAVEEGMEEAKEPKAES